MLVIQPANSLVVCLQPNEVAGILCTGLTDSLIRCVAIAVSLDLHWFAGTTILMPSDKPRPDYQDIALF